MSAPPIEATVCQPKASAIAVITSRHRTGAGAVRANKITIRMKRNHQRRRVQLMAIGQHQRLGGNLPRNLPNATTEPVKVTAPMKIEEHFGQMNIDQNLLHTGFMLQVAVETHQHAASPTKLCRIATSSGISVISTFFARRIPIAPPITIARIIQPTLPASGPVMVAIRAMAIPAMPK